MNTREDVLTVREASRFPKLTYATIQHGLLKVLVERKVGRSGLAVMIALCSCIYANGKLGVASSERIQDITGLNAVQVMHGIKELRDKEIVHTVTRKLKSGAMKADRSMPGHVALTAYLVYHYPPEDRNIGGRKARLSKKLLKELCPWISCPLIR